MAGGAGFAWAVFAACAGAIAIAGAVLCHEGDAIAEKTGLSRSWIGLVLLATVTSLPELVTGVSSVVFANVPEIAVGDVLGSCVFNLGLLGAIFLAVPRLPPVRRHRVSAAFGIALLGLAALGFVLPLPAAGWVGLYTPAIAVAYLFAMRTLVRHERASVDVAGSGHGGSLRRSVRRFAIAALVVTAAGSWLPFVSARIAEAMGWSESFFGTLFVAGATSLPEVAVTVSAIRIGALDMAIGNLFGSNLFDMAILAVDDALFTPGPILEHVSRGHLSSIAVAIAMSGLAMLRANRWTGAALVLLYVANAVMLYRYGAASA